MKVALVARREIKELSSFYRKVIRDISYYSDVAKKSELRKFSPRALLKKIKDKNNLFIFAKEGNKIIGASNGHYDDGLYWMEWRVVDIGWRRKGVGQKMFQFLEKRLKKEGIHKIWCDSRTNNKESKAFLSKMGMKKIVTIPNHWYKQDFIIWQKVIK